MPSPLLACRGTTNNAQREKVHAVPQKLGKTLITSCRFVAATARITSTHTTRIVIVAAVQKRVNNATHGKYNMWPLLQHYCNISQRSETLGDLWDGGRKIRLSVHPCETYLPPPEAPSTCTGKHIMILMNGSRISDNATCRSHLPLDVYGSEIAAR